MSIAATRTLALGALAVFLVGCASGETGGRSPGNTRASSFIGTPAATGSGATGGTPCINPDPVAPSPVQPAVPGVSADGNIAKSWSLDDAITVAPAAGAAPVISRERALCTLLAALDVRGSGLLDDDHLTLILGKVTVSDALVASPLPFDAGPAPTAFHSRLAWVAVIDPPIMAACPMTQSPVSASSSSSDVDVSPNVSNPPVVVPYQLVVLDAVTGTDGLVYAARTNNPCGSGALDGPYVRRLLVLVSVPWRLISRDSKGLFGTIALAVRTCDNVSEYEGAYATDAGVVEFDVSRPIANCGTRIESVQTLYGPAAGDRLATTLTHAATGFVDTAAPCCTLLPSSVW